MMKLEQSCNPLVCLSKKAKASYERWFSDNKYVPNNLEILGKHLKLLKLC